MNFDDVLKWEIYLNKLVDKHHLSLADQIKDTLSRCCRTEITSEGKNLGYRGNYDPSLLAQNVISNIKKGRVYKRHPTDMMGTYEIGFDCEDRVIYSRHNDSAEENKWITHEFIWYENNSQYSVAWNEIPEDNFFEKVAFTLLFVEQGRPQLYMLMNYCDGMKKVLSLDLEEYVYKNDMLCEIVVHSIAVLEDTKKAKKFEKKYGGKVYGDKIYLVCSYKLDTM